MDTTSMNPKGHVKLELYDESGVFFTKEKKNLVVTSSHEIVANMMSNPAKTSRLRQQDVGDTPVTANENGMFVLELSTKENQKRTVSQDVLSTNTETLFNILDLKSITEILEALSVIFFIINGFVSISSPSILYLLFISISIKFF